MRTIRSSGIEGLHSRESWWPAGRFVEAPRRKGVGVSGDLGEKPQEIETGLHDGGGDRVPLG
jgi:hypothetical protein